MGNYVEKPPKPKLRLAINENSLFLLSFLYFSKSSVSRNARWQKKQFSEKKSSFLRLAKQTKSVQNVGGVAKLTISCFNNLFLNNALILPDEPKWMFCFERCCFFPWTRKCKWNGYLMDIAVSESIILFSLRNKPFWEYNFRNIIFKVSFWWGIILARYQREWKRAIFDHFAEASFYRDITVVE